jgi:hypothetical protein
VRDQFMPFPGELHRALQHVDTTGLEHVVEHG